MERKMMSKYLRLGLGLVVLGATACGGAGGSNDQGVSFSFLGYYQGPTTAALPEVSLPVSIGGEEDEGYSGLEETLFACFLNGLSGEFLRVDRLIYEFNAPGAGVSIPSTNTGFTLFLGPAVPALSNSNLPPGFSGSAPSNVNCGRVLVVPPDIAQFIVLNKGFFPEETFTVEMRVSASGVSSSGNRFTTPAQSFLLLFTTDNTIPPIQDDPDNDDTEEDSFQEL